MKLYTIYILIFLQGICLIQNANSQISFLDGPIFLTIRKVFLKVLSAFQNLDLSNKFGKIQKQYLKSESFFCDTKTSPGKRSSIRPNTIHKLTPGDIDIIAAMGDSMISANGAAGLSPLELGLENRGMSWAIGGAYNWRKYITLPNILKEFNPNLYGYSTGSVALSTDRSSKFNTAEAGAMSRDMYYQAQVLYNRLKHDPKVNMTRDWKMVTIMFGANDFCTDMCYYNNTEIPIRLHEKDMLKTLRFLRDNIPRLIVNWVVSANITVLYDFKGMPESCKFVHIIECPCIISKTQETVDLYNNAIKKWIDKDYEIAYMNEFNSDNFTVNIQPFTRNPKFPKLKNGLHDYRYMSTDCFHFSQRFHVLASNGIWNNLLEPDGIKVDRIPVKINIKCPTEERPFIATRENSLI